jgi:hypothetical protein
MTIDSDNQPSRHDSSGHEPLRRQATTAIIAVIVNVDVDALLLRPISKDRALQALSARREIVDRMLHHRWLATETARSAGATWAEIDNALGLAPGLSRREYEAALARQKHPRLAAHEGHDPGPPMVPDI